MPEVGGQVVWDFDGRDAGLNAAMAEARAKGQGLAQSLSAEWDKTLGASQKFAAGVLVVGAAIGAVGFSAVKSAAQYEQNRIAFDTMLGSAELGKKTLAELSDFARRTPFELPQVVEGAKQLLAYNISAEKLIPTFNALGNIAAGVGRDKMPQLILAFGQVKAAGRLTGMELRQFTEAGVPLLEVLAKQSGKTAAQVKDDMERGMAPSFEEVEKAIFSMSQEGGKFFNLMERQSASLSGVMSNIKDQIGRTARNIVGISDTGDIREGSLFAHLRDGALRLLNFLDKNQDKFLQFFDQLSSTVAKLGPIIASVIVGGVLPALANMGLGFAAMLIRLSPFMVTVTALYGLFKLLENVFGSSREALIALIPIATVAFTVLFGPAVIARIGEAVAGMRALTTATVAVGAAQSSAAPGIAATGTAVGGVGTRVSALKSLIGTGIVLGFVATGVAVTVNAIDAVKDRMNENKQSVEQLSDSNKGLSQSQSDLTKSFVTSNEEQRQAILNGVAARQQGKEANDKLSDSFKGLDGTVKSIGPTIQGANPAINDFIFTMDRLGVGINQNSFTIREALSKIPLSAQQELGRANVIAAAEAGKTPAAILSEFQNLPPKLKLALGALPQDVAINLDAAQAQGVQSIAKWNSAFSAETNKATISIGKELDNLPFAVQRSFNAAQLEGVKGAFKTVDTAVGTLAELPNGAGYVLFPTAGVVAQNLSDAQLQAQIKSLGIVKDVEGNLKIMPLVAGQAVAPTPNSVAMALQGTSASASLAVSGTPGSVQTALSPTPGAAASALQGTPAAASDVLSGTPGSASLSVSGTPGAVGQSLAPTPGAAAGAVRPTTGAVDRELSGMESAGDRHGSGLMRALEFAIRSAGGGPVGAVVEIVKRIRDLLPGSDAKTGPLSDLTASGRALAETFALGIRSGAPAVSSAVSDMATASANLLPGGSFSTSGDVAVESSSGGPTVSAQTVINAKQLTEADIDMAANRNSFKIGMELGGV